MFQKISTAFVIAALALSVGCAGGKETTKKDEQPKQEQAQPQPQPQPEPQPAPPPQPPPPPPTCTNTQVLENNACVEVANVLQGMRVEIPCKPAGKKADECAAAVAKPSKAVQLGGSPGKAYDVTLRIRGVVEPNSYSGGQVQDFWSAGGKPSDKKANAFQLELTAPAQTYFLNAGNPGKRAWAMDYTRTIRIDSGATVTLTGDSQDGKLVPNRDSKNNPQIVPDVPPAPAAFDGQFVQIDVVSVAPAR